ncbi:hypothetical protein [Boudabousia marimammalium]|uniref:hypothetical protein n=1 Tax=Boudabousia marimammalium TaxID=156892 RepID=UPI000A00D163|nr:hypothetical protein [Boudabousia marimammalium]
MERLGEESCILITTHQVEDLAYMASDVQIMDAGQLLYTGSAAELTEIGEAHAEPGLSTIEAGYQYVLSNRQ